MEQEAAAARAQVQQRLLMRLEEEQQLAAAQERIGLEEIHARRRCLEGDESRTRATCEAQAARFERQTRNAIILEETAAAFSTGEVRAEADQAHRLLTVEEEDVARRRSQFHL
eukprot:9478572-Pyramimonas_sp.AAC.1